MTRVNCSEFLLEIGNLLDGEMASDMRAHLEQHLLECKACEVVYDSTRKTIQILTDTCSFELRSADLRSTTDDIMARIRALQ